MGTKKKATKKKSRSQLARAIHRAHPQWSVDEIAAEVKRRSGKAIHAQSVRNALRASDRIGRPPQGVAA